MKYLVAILTALTALVLVGLLVRCSAASSLAMPGAEEAEENRFGEGDQIVVGAESGAQTGDGAVTARVGGERLERVAIETFRLFVDCRAYEGDEIAGIEIVLEQVEGEQAGAVLTRTLTESRVVFGGLERGTYELSLSSLDFVPKRTIDVYGNARYPRVDVQSETRTELVIEPVIAAVVVYRNMTVLGDALDLRSGGLQLDQETLGPPLRPGNPHGLEHVRAHLRSKFPGARVFATSVPDRRRVAGGTVRTFSSEAGLVEHSVEVAPPGSIDQPTALLLDRVPADPGHLIVDVLGHGGVRVPLTGILVTAAPSATSTGSGTHNADASGHWLFEQPVRAGDRITLPPGDYTVNVPRTQGRAPSKLPAKVVAEETTRTAVRLAQTLYPYRFKPWADGGRVDTTVLLDVRRDGDPLVQMFEHRVHEKVHWLPAGDFEVTATASGLGKGTRSFSRSVDGFDEQLVVIQLVD